MELVSNTTDYMMEKLGETWKYVFAGIILAIVGSVMMLPYATAITGWTFWGIVIFEFIILFGFIFTKNPIMYYGFTFFTGVTLVPLVAKFISVGAAGTIVLAFTLTAVITGGLTIHAMTTKKNYLGLGTMLFWILLGIIVVSLINIFIIGSSMLALIISIGIAVLFSFFIVHDTQQVIYTDITPIEGAMGLYLDILNMFTSLLHILDALDD